ncbi:hypothetical protein L2E82_31299 [Cichorium intybus]|uniref:Uncharacterized protein n=1 Tax=Cichorium intybus TaxID=13427 RepID=A0ACB9D308_CICIN|nr:hypothetical protein L2E82_31299 [Cichorium intybus]
MPAVWCGDNGFFNDHRELLSFHCFRLKGNWNYFAAVRSEKRAPELEATHLEKAKELYTKHPANMYAANGAGVVLAEKGQFDIAKEVQETFRPSPKHAVLHSHQNIFDNQVTSVEISGTSTYMAMKIQQISSLSQHDNWQPQHHTSLSTNKKEDCGEQTKQKRDTIYTIEIRAPYHISTRVATNVPKAHMFKNSGNFTRETTIFLLQSPSDQNDAILAKQKLLLTLDLGLRAMNWLEQLQPSIHRMRVASSPCSIKVRRHHRRGNTTINGDWREEGRGGG